MGKIRVLAESYREHNGVKFSFLNDEFGIFAWPGEENEYEISFQKRYEDGEEEIFALKFKLTDEEYDAAMDSSIEDWMFVENVDGMVSKRVAKDIFSKMLKSLNKPLGYEKITRKYYKEWEEYAKYLIHERMEGRTIAPYEPGFEPTEENA